MSIHTEYLQDGSSEFRVVQIGPDVAADQMLEPVAFGNGKYEDVDVLTGLAQALVDHAAADGRYLRVTLHDRPAVGKTAQGLVDCSERFDQVVEHTTDEDLPVLLVGHSHGWPQVVNAATRRMNRGRNVGAVLGISPCGLTPIGANPAALVNMAGVGMREVAANTRMLWRSKTARHIGMNALRDIALTPWSSITEGQGVLVTDVIAETVELHGKLAADGVSRMRLLAGERDGVFPLDIMRKNLEKAGYAMTDFLTIDTTHGGPLTDRSLIPGIYDALMLRRSVDVADSADYSAVV